MSLILAVVALAEIAAPITVEVTNVRNDHGRIHVAFCAKDKFLSHACPYEASAPAHPGTTLIIVPGIPPGDYAAQSFHDENNNHEIDRGMFGIPKEGIGFSRDARIHMGPPKWADAVITHPAQPQTIRLAMRYCVVACGAGK